MSSMAILGWDIGGAHLKWAVCDTAGQLLRVGQRACPLWQGLNRLEQALDQVMAELAADDGTAPEDVLHVATMSGELVDAFSDRTTGVQAIVRCAEAQVAGRWRWFGVDGRLVEGAQAFDHPQQLASANWLASATLAARYCDGLLIDMGSTTTDIIALREGRPRVFGHTDGTRLDSGELVYRGLVRTPVMALAAEVPWQAGSRPLAAELFATTADVMRICGELDESVDVYPPCDGAEKTRAGSMRRLARMIGEDAASVSAKDLNSLARYCADLLIGVVATAAQRVAEAAQLPAAAPVVCAGIGHAFIRRVASRLGRPAISLGDLVAAGQSAGLTCHAPAAALALLAARGTLQDNPPA